MGDSKPGSPAPASDDHESILAQFIYAFAQGAGSMRVSRRALVALRSRYLGPVQASASAWDARAAYVLPLLGQVGRLASLLATQSGRSAITEADFTEARRIVEARTHDQAESSGQLTAGPLCPAIAEEQADRLQGARVTSWEEHAGALPPKSLGAVFEAETRARPLPH